MATRKKGASAPRPRSGFATEEQRKTERLTLRLPPAAMDLLYELSTALGDGDDEKVTYAQTVERALVALKAELEAEAD